MGSKAKTDPRDTYIFSDEVMDEMQNLEASAELLGLEDLPQDDDAIAVPDKKRRVKATGDDSA
jgi:hypothetical protein